MGYKKYIILCPLFEAVTVIHSGGHNEDYSRKGRGNEGKRSDNQRRCYEQAIDIGNAFNRNTGICGSV